jgi:acetyl esterase/lipase
MTMRKPFEMPTSLWTLAVVLAVLLQAGCSPPRSIEALLVVADIAAGAGESRLKAATAPPIRKTISYAFEGRVYTADVYWPGGSEPAEAVTILVPGVVRLGKGDPRLVVFAQTLARARFLVFVPDLVNLRQLNVSSKDAEALARAARYVALRAGVGKDASVGMMAFSYAAGPALLAAMAEETRETVRFVYAVGPYFSIETAVTYLTTGHFRRNANSPWRQVAPSAYATWVFILSCAAWLDDPDDRRILTAIADMKLADPDAEISGLLAQLGAEGRKIHALLANTDPQNVPGLIAGLPEPVRSELRTLDLSRRDLNDLKARLILIHGRDDLLIPHTESIALSADLDGDRSRLFIVDSLKHVELQFAGISDVFKLWRAVRTLLEERDKMPRPSWKE